MACEVKKEHGNEMSAADRDTNSRLQECWTEDYMAFFGTQSWAESIGST